MIRKYLFITVAAVLFCFTGFAQEKLFSMQDAVVGQYVYFNPTTLPKLRWRPETDTYTYVYKENIYEGKTAAGKAKIILGFSDISAALEKAGMEKLGYFDYDWLTKDVFRFDHGNDLVLFSLSKKSIVKVFHVNPDASPFYEGFGDYYNFSDAAGYVAYTVNDNLFISNAEGKETQVTTDGGNGIVNGRVVHRNEFGINEGTFWSSKGNFLAFYRKDESMVTQYPLVNIVPHTAEVNYTKYPMAGMKSEEVTLGVYDVKNNTTVFLKTGEPKEQFLTNISWSPDEKSIYIAVLNREQNHMKFNRYNAATGEFEKTLFEEKNEKYVEPLHPAIFIKDGKNFLWRSRNGGHDHFYLYDTEGNLLKQVTSGEWDITDFLGFDSKEENLFIEATKESPVERHIYKVNIESGEVMKLSAEKGVHSGKLSKSGNYIIDSWSSTSVPKEICLYNSQGKEKRVLHTSENLLKDYKMPEMSIFTIKAGDGKTDLWCRLIKPVDFDPAKKYPAIIYVYGGPHVQLVSESWLGDGDLWQYYMAQNGYVMLTVDNRGSSGRGLEFENVIHRQVGTCEVEDQLKGWNYLKDQGYVDMSRVGVHGWSFGGFMTTSLMLLHPDKFKVGVAGGPVIDWGLYEVMYGERYMDTPQENPEGYQKNCLLNYADKLEGRLMLIHGAQDPTVLWQNSLQFINECIKNKKQLDYFVYPNHEHNVRGMDRIHLMEKVTQYFKEYL